MLKFFTISNFHNRTQSRLCARIGGIRGEGTTESVCSSGTTKTQFRNIGGCRDPSSLPALSFSFWLAIVHTYVPAGFSFILPANVLSPEHWTNCEFVSKPISFSLPNFSHVALNANYLQWASYLLVLASPRQMHRSSPTTSGPVGALSSCTRGIGSRTGAVMGCSGATRYSHVELTGIVICLPCLEVEYMVASFDNDARNVKLSFRQSEISAKLHAVIGDISSNCPDQ